LDGGKIEIGVDGGNGGADDAEGVGPGAAADADDGQK